MRRVKGNFRSMRSGGWVATSGEAVSIRTVRWMEDRGWIRRVGVGPEWEDPRVLTELGERVASEAR